MKWILFAIAIILPGMENKTVSQSDETYKALGVAELNAIEEKKSAMIDTSYQLDYNKAFVTIFKDKTATLFPGNGGGEGLLFFDIPAMERMIAEKKFPVKGDSSFWENEKERVLQFGQSIPYYVSRLSQLLQFEVNLSNDAAYLKELSAVINQAFSKKKIDSTLYSYAAIYIGELIRLKAKGEWKLAPVYTLNVYYIPEIVKNKTYCNFWSVVINDLSMASYMPVDIEKLVEDAAEFAPFTTREYADTQ